MVVTLGQQYNTGDKPIVILYIDINRHAGTPDEKQKQNRNNLSTTTSNMVVIIYCFIGCKKERVSTWYLNGFLDGSNRGSTV